MAGSLQVTAVGSRLRHRRWAWVAAAVCAACTLLLVAVKAGAQEVRQGAGDPFRAVIDFVIAQDPVLEAQRASVSAARQLGDLQRGEVGMVPQFAQSQLLQAELVRANEIVQAQERYTQMERTLIQEVLGRVREIMARVNRLESLQDLQRLLAERVEAAERQVQAGLMSPIDLWTLSDRAVEVNTSIADTGDELSTLLRETAFSYGGDDWRGLLDLLEQFADQP